MKYFLLCLGLFFGTQTSFSQKLNFVVCNEFEELELRDKCIKSSLDNLFVKKLLQLRLEKKEEPNSQIDVSFEVHVSRVGLFTLRNFESNNPSVYTSFNQILIDIVPLNSYKQNNRLVQSTLEFDYSLRFIENSNIEIIQSGKRIYSSRRPAKEEDSDKKKDEVEKLDLTDNTKSETEVDMPFAVIENVPIFPGCEPLQTNSELKDCMSGNISSFMISNFDTEIANKLEMPDGRVRISMQFKINTDGYVIDIMARAPHPELEKEAIRVINSLPKFEPGKQKGENVNVLYSLPILFQVENDHKTKK